MNILDFLPLTPATVCWQPMVSRDQDGSPSWGSVQTFNGRRVFKAERVAAYERGTKGQGAEVLSASVIWIMATPPPNVGYEDLVYMNGDVTTNTQGAVIVPPILSFSTFMDETGAPLYMKVFLGSSNG